MRRLLALTRARLYTRPPFSAVMRRLVPRAAVLVYHRVAHCPVDPHRLAVPPALFERHLRALATEYTILSIGELLDLLPTRAYPDRSVVLTFDDGYADTLLEAQPVAAHVGFPLCVFVTPVPILRGEPFWWDELTSRFPYSSSTSAQTPESHTEGGIHPEHARLHSALKALPAVEREGAMVGIRERTRRYFDPLGLARPLSVGELRELSAAPSVTIGAHTANHPSLGFLAASEQRRELTLAKELVENIVERPVDLAAYPFGKGNDLSGQTLRLTAQAGYRAAFTTEPFAVLPWRDAWRLPRLSVHAWPEPTLLRRLRALFGDLGS